MAKLWNRKHLYMPNESLDHQRQLMIEHVLCVFTTFIKQEEKQSDVAPYRRLNLFARVIVAIDGSKANNSDMNFTLLQLEQWMQPIDESIERYLNALDPTDWTQLSNKSLQSREALGS